MIPKTQRLTRRDIEALHKRGGGERSTFVVRLPSLFVVAQRSETFKAGVSVSKKVYKLSTERNRVRRVIYNLLREEGLLSLPFHLLISVKKDAGSDIYMNLQAEIGELSLRLGERTS